MQELILESFLLYNTIKGRLWRMDYEKGGGLRYHA